MEIDALVIGGTGLLGKEIIKDGEFQYTYYNSKLSDINAYYLDISNFENTRKFLENFKPKKIILTSAITDVDLCEKNPELAFITNYKALYAITEYIKKVDGYLVFISTDYVFDGKSGLYKEENEKNPINIYGKSKSLAENIIFSSGIRYAIIRPSVIFGAEESHGKKNFFLWIYENLKENKEIKVLEDQIVSPTLNIYLAEATKEIFHKKYQGVFHVAGKEPVSRYEMALKIQELFELKGKIVPISINDMKWIAPRPKNS